MSIAATIQSINPVLDRELRQRARSPRSITIMTIFLLLTLAVAIVTYAVETQNSFDSTVSFGLGRTIFEFILIMELTIILLIVPGISASSISGENDRQTLAPMQITLLGPISIFFGKVASSVSYVLLLLIASLPILTLSYVAGGVSLKSIIWALISLTVTTIFIAIIGVAVSSITKSTVLSILMTYGFILLSVVLPFVMSLVIGILSIGNGDLDAWIVAPNYLNPYITLSGAAGEVTSNISEPWPLSGTKGAFVEIEDGYNSSNAGDKDVSYVPLFFRTIIPQSFLVLLFALSGISKLRSPISKLKQ